MNIEQFIAHCKGYFCASHRIKFVMVENTVQAQFVSYNGFISVLASLENNEIVYW